ncbi:CcmD family protein [Zhaonella formicivorans]|jgi:CcmD family protein|nr:CcmD family protein [Zhaonella formicivorans]
MKYVWAAYSIVMVLIFLYTWTLGKRQSKLAQEVSMLQKTLEKQMGR